MRPSGADELAEGDPSEVALENARRKASAVGGELVLGVDTLVALDGRIYGKPADERDAARMLRALSGTTHRVLTAVAIQSGRKRVAAVSDSRVTFARLTPAQVRAYVESGEPMGKAGAYAVQGAAAAYISRISGSYSGIMGLPMYETAKLLRALRLVP